MLNSKLFINKTVSIKVPSHHRMLPDKYEDKQTQSHHSRSPNLPRERPEQSEPRKIASEFTIKCLHLLQKISLIY